MTAVRSRVAWISAWSVLLVPSAVLACRYTVRDVGFVDLGAPPYRLHLLVRGDTPEEVPAAYKQASYAVLMDANVKLDVVNVDRQKDHPSVAYVAELGIDSFPAAVLVSPRGRPLLLSAPTDKDPKRAAWACLEGTVTSPVRAEAVEHLAEAYCVVLLIEGKEASENRRAEQAVKAAIDEIDDVMHQMPKPTEKPPRLIRVPAKGLSEEEILLWALGLDADEIDGPRAVVLYGRGRWIGPMFEGAGITQAAIGPLLSVIGGSCECGMDRERMLGVMLPLRWERSVQTQSIRSLGFDPENPMVKVEISRILSMAPTAAGRDDSAALGGLVGYSEQTIEFAAAPNETTLPPSQLRELSTVEVNGAATRRSDDQPRSEPSSGQARSRPEAVVGSEKRTVEADADSGLSVVWSIVGGMVLLVLAGGVFIMLRAHRRAA